MKHRSILFSLVLGLSLQLCGLSQMRGDTTSPVGFTTASQLANSDTLLSVPFLRPLEADELVQSVSTSVITVQGSPGWTPNQFVYAAGSQPNNYFVLLGAGGSSNPREGHYYKITANTANTLTVSPAGDDLTGVTANTEVMVIPYWTLGTVYPADKAGVSFTATASSSSYQTEILVPKNTANGVNLPVTTYFFSNNIDGTNNNVGWRKFGDNLTPHDDDILLPNSYFVVRNQNGAPTLPLRGLGDVLTGKLATILRTKTSGPQDNAVSMVRPIGVTLNQTGLSPSDGSFVGTTQPSQVKDQLLIFNNAQVAHNKRPSATYFYYTGTGGPQGWKKKGAGTADRGNDVIPAGSAIVIRKAATTTGATVAWTNAPTY